MARYGSRYHKFQGSFVYDVNASWSLVAGGFFTFAGVQRGARARAARRRLVSILMSPVDALILAGGQSRRMGGGDKGLLEIHGRSILARVVEMLRPQCAHLLLSANGDSRTFSQRSIFPSLPTRLPTTDHSPACWPGWTGPPRIARRRRRYSAYRATRRFCRATSSPRSCSRAAPTTGS